jgi:hypothetical protein
MQKKLAKKIYRPPKKYAKPRGGPPLEEDLVENLDNFRGIEVQQDYIYTRDDLVRKQKQVDDDAANAAKEKQKKADDRAAKKAKAEAREIRLKNKKKKKSAAATKRKVAKAKKDKKESDRVAKASKKRKSNLCWVSMMKFLLKI